jgi:hypothetical protein
MTACPARGMNNGHTGLTHVVRADIEQHGPSTAPEIAARIGSPEPSVRSALTTLTNVNYVLERIPAKPFSRYQIRTKPKPSKPGDDLRIAQPITIGRGFKWGAGRA